MLLPDDIENAILDEQGQQSEHRPLDKALSSRLSAIQGPPVIQSDTLPFTALLKSQITVIELIPISSADVNLLDIDNDRKLS